MGKEKQNKKPEKNAGNEKKKSILRQPFTTIAGMLSVSTVFLIILSIAGAAIGEKDTLWAFFLMIGLHIVPCLTFWELAFSTKIYGYDLREKKIPEGVYPIRRVFHVIALIFTNLCGFFVIPGIAVIWEERYFAPLVFGLLIFGLPSAFFWFKTFEYRLFKKNYEKHLKKEEEKAKNRTKEKSKEEAKPGKKAGKK